MIGFALFAFYIATGMGISRTIWGLWIGHILYSTPYVIGTVGAALASYERLAGRGGAGRSVPRRCARFAR